MSHIRPEINKMKRNVFLLLIGIIFFAAGCTMIPEYNRPEAPVPAKWPSGPAYKQTPQKARAVEELSWRQFFTDERLQTVIASALQNTVGGFTCGEGARIV